MPIIGATVRIQGSDIATATDADGRFSLSGFKTSNKYLEVSSIGYETKIVEIKPELTIHLAVKSEMMDEVMVVAFGKQKRESFTGSASVLSADAIAKQQVTNPIEALDGLVTGLQMTQTNSFGSDPSILIRGIGSINASTEPLIVLDGLPYNGYWNDINPADIQKYNGAQGCRIQRALRCARCQWCHTNYYQERAAWRNESQHHGKVGCEHRRPHTV